MMRRKRSIQLLGRRDVLRAAAALGVGVTGGARVRSLPGQQPRSRSLAAQEATPVASAAAPQPATTPTRPPGDPRAGGIVTIGSVAEPDTLHPWLTRTLAGFDVLDGVMEGLLRYDSEQQLQPALAESYEISEDDLTYTFSLRQDVRFHNGDLFTADDFIAAWETKLSPEFNVDNTLGWDRIVDVTVEDDGMLAVTLDQPYAPFLSTVGTAYLVPRSTLAEGLAAFQDALARTPIGTGPMQVTAWEAGDRIELVRFDTYWGDRPRLDGVVYQIVPDTGTLLAGLRSGAIQVVGGTGAFGADQVDKALGIARVVVIEHPTQNWQHIDLKQIGFLRETRVRQALDFATPRQRIIDELLAGRAIPAVADQAPGTWAYNEEIAPRPFDPARAAALLDEAGLEIGPDGVRARDGERFTIELWGLADDPLAAQINPLVAASWNALGVATTLHFDDAATIWGPMGYQFSDRMTAALYVWTNANDPDDLFYWHSSQIPSSPTGPGGNLPAFFYPYRFQEAIDALTARAATTTGREERQELYGQIQELLAREVPVIFLYWEQAFPAVARNVGGFWPSAFNNLLWNVGDWYLTETGAATSAASPVTLG